VKIGALYVYPVKSGRGMAVDRWPLDARGLAHDREYMVVDPEGTFLTQREAPRLALIEPSFEDGRLRVSTPGGTAITAPAGTREVTVWEHTGPAVDCGDEVADLLSTLLDRPCRLVTTAAEHRRPTEDGCAEIAFADGYPLLLISDSSLTELNRRLPEALPMDRFRPNVVIEHAEPFAEDAWATVDLGDVRVDVLKPCARCAITRVDQATGIRGDGEPLRTLGTFRKAKGGVMFGQNAAHRTTGELAVGDAVTVRMARV
jgi:uncharacterized protein YcbX